MPEQTSLTAALSTILTVGSGRAWASARGERAHDVRNVQNVHTGIKEDGRGADYGIGFLADCGTGQPRQKYEDTRHNMGFMAADVLAERWTVNFADHKGLAMLGKSVMNLDGRTVKFFLAKPLTYMNDSGNAVASISAYYQIEPDHIVVIHDDMDLEFGRIKVKAGGSAGGHNGIKSIDRSLGTPKYARVRMGVGHPSAVRTRMTTR